jgi:hypothetical protein
MKYLVPTLIAAVAAAAGFIAARAAPQSFAECYLEQMRGEVEAMSMFAASVCQSRTGLSVSEAVKQLGLK